MIRSASQAQPDLPRYGAKPHAVTQAGSNVYTYDANGNLTSGAGRTLAWDSANRLTQITTAAAGATLLYGPGGARWKQVKTAAGGAVTTVRYVSPLYEESTAAGVTEKRHHLFAGGERIALYTTATSGTSSLKYLHQDHLGSTDAVTNALGTVTERLSYDPHGKRRNANWTNAAATLASFSTDRGYTGHEHLDEVGLIHMNGRVYDPTLGRFLSADPVIQFPDTTQGLNRYSYVYNNPLSFTDPTGLFLGGVFKAIGNAFKSIAKAIGSVFRAIGNNIRSILSAGLAVLAAPYGIPMAMLGGFSAGLLASGGDLRMGLVGALSAGAFSALGGLDPGLGKVFAHGMVGGVGAELQGGDFGPGFLSAGFVEGVQASGAFNDLPGAPGTYTGEVVRASAAAVVGGTASVIGGGKFSNGAVTGGFAYAFSVAAAELRAHNRGRMVYPEGGAQNPSAYGAIQGNGILVAESDFILTVDKSGYPGWYNPSHGFLPDVVEVLNQRLFGWSDPMAADLSAALAGVEHPIDLILHSQATLFGTNAARYYGLPAGSHLILNSPVVSSWRASAAAAAIGGRLTYNLPMGDVSNLLVPSLNPVRFGSGFRDLTCRFCVHGSTDGP